MIEHLTYIEICGSSYPVKCDLAVLEAIQDEYKKLTDFEDKLSGLIPTGKRDPEGRKLYKQGEPSIKAVRFVLPLMINEGIDIENRIEGGNRKHVSEADLKEAMIRFNIFDIAHQLHLEFMKCFESKNRKSTQGEENKSR